MDLVMVPVCLAGDLGERIAAAAAAGFDGIEIYEDHLHASGLPAREVRRMAADQGLRIVSLQPLRGFEALPDELRADAFNRAERCFDLMGELGTDLLGVTSNVSPQTLDGEARAAADLAELGERARARGMRIAYEAIAWGTQVHDVAQAWSVIRQADHPCVGVLLDTFHTFLRRCPLADVAAIPGERIFLVHLDDAPVLAVEPVELSRHHRCLLGQGSFAVAEFVEKLDETGYRGPLSLEIFSDALLALPAPKAAREVFGSFRWLDARLRERRKQGTAGQPGAIARGLEARLRRNRSSPRAKGAGNLKQKTH